MSQVSAPDSGLVSLDPSIHSFVSVVVAKVQAKLVIVYKKAQMKGTMKWLPYMSTSVLNKMCDIMKSGVRTRKGFKEIHLSACAKALFEHYVTDVSGT
jgi:prolyl-tRNA synthetase